MHIDNMGVYINKLGEYTVIDTMNSEAFKKTSRLSPYHLDRELAGYGGFYQLGKLVRV